MGQVARGCEAASDGAKTLTHPHPDPLPQAAIGIELNRHSGRLWERERREKCEDGSDGLRRAQSSRASPSQMSVVFPTLSDARIVAIIEPAMAYNFTAIE